MIAPETRGSSPWDRDKLGRCGPLNCPGPRSSWPFSFSCWGVASLRSGRFGLASRCLAGAPSEKDHLALGCLCFSFLPCIPAALADVHRGAGAGLDSHQADETVLGRLPGLRSLPCFPPCRHLSVRQHRRRGCSQAFSPADFASAGDTLVIPLRIGHPGTWCRGSRRPPLRLGMFRPDSGESGVLALETPVLALSAPRASACEPFCEAFLTRGGLRATELGNSALSAPWADRGGASAWVRPRIPGGCHGLLVFRLWCIPAFRGSQPAPGLSQSGWPACLPELGGGGSGYLASPTLSFFFSEYRQGC